MGELKHYAAVKPHMLSGGTTAAALCTRFSLAGTEVYFDDLVPRNDSLWTTEEEEAALISRIRELRARRAHASYWAWPSAFLTGRNRTELYRRMGGPDAVAAYYGDESGEHVFSRWVSEYALCARLGLEAYTFHLIDYAPIDGKWAFTLPRQEILQAMGEILARLLVRLEAAGLLRATSPRIELENAGWGLEYGAQTAGDFARILDSVQDKHHRLRIAWDCNHLLHAVGTRCFLLPKEELQEGMAALEGRADLPLAWLRSQLDDPRLRGRLGAVHLSDRLPTGTEFFRRGKLDEPWFSTLNALPDEASQEEYGAALVLDHYDSHVPLGSGVLPGRETAQLLQMLARDNPDFAILHELKNSEDILADLAAQREALGGRER